MSKSANKQKAPQSGDSTFPDNAVDPQADGGDDDADEEVETSDETTRDESGGAHRTDTDMVDEYERGRSTFEEDDITGAAAPAGESPFGDDDVVDGDDDLTVRDGLAP